jgi:hypothetical protein
MGANIRAPERTYPFWMAMDFLRKERSKSVWKYRFRALNGCVIGAYRVIDGLEGQILVKTNRPLFVMRVLSSDREDALEGDYILGWMWWHSSPTFVRYKGTHFGDEMRVDGGIGIIRPQDKTGILLVVREYERGFSYRAFGNKIILERVERKKEGLIELPDHLAYSEGYGIVRSVGSDVKHVKVGDNVIYDRSKAYVLERFAEEVDGEKTEKAYVVVSEDDVYGTYEALDREVASAGAG